MSADNTCIMIALPGLGQNGNAYQVGIECPLILVLNIPENGIVLPSKVGPGES